MSVFSQHVATVARRWSSAFGVALILTALFATANTAQAQFAISTSSSPNAAKPPKTDHAERSLAAIDLAIFAAEAGIMDVSLEAMSRAVAKGPPVASVDLGGLLSSGPRVRRSSSRNNPAQTEAATAQMKLAKRLDRLHAAWLENEFDPKQAYSSWKELVLPSKRPNEAFPYSAEPPLNSSYSYSNIPFDYKRPEAKGCGAKALVSWARKAEQLDDLKAELETRGKMPGAQATALLLRAIMAQDESTPIAEVEEICKELTKKSKLLIADQNAKLLMSHVIKMLDRFDGESETREQLLTKVLEDARSNPQWVQNDWLEYLVSERLRESVERGDEEEFKQAYNMALTRYDRIRSNNTEYVASQEAQGYSKAASLAFDAGHVGLGINCLRAQNKVAVGERYGGSQASGLLDPKSSINKHLMKLDVKERGDLLNELVWEMPMLGLRQSGKLTPTQTIPTLFTSKLNKSDLPRQQLVGDEAITMSLLEWAMRDALQNGKEDDLRQRIKDKEEAGSDDSKLAKFVLQLAKNEPIDFAALISKEKPDGSKNEGESEKEDDKKSGKTGDKDSGPQFEQLLGDGDYILPLDLELLQRALQNEQYHDLALKHLDRMLELSRTRHFQRELPWLRRMKFEDALARGEKVTTHNSLKHWIVAEDINSEYYRWGNVPYTVWVKRDGDGWGHEFGVHMSYLMIRYPFEGDCTITLRSKDGIYEEQGAMLAGFVAEFFQHDSTMRTWGVSERGTHTSQTDAVKGGEFNDIKLVRKGNKLTIIIGDNKFEKTIDLVSNSYPFFGINSFEYRSTTFDSLKIEGDITIPRSVDLLSPSLLGWSTNYRRQRLAQVKHIDEMTVPEPKDPKKIEHDWQFVDGVCESVDHSGELTDKEKEAAKDETPRREALIQYLRPLWDGEEISLEFYYEAGKFSLSPAIGTIAMDLSKPQNVGLHWITSGAKEWTGLGSKNLVIDEDAKQLGELKLKEKEWNSLAVRFEGDQLVLKINGTDVYQRVWDKQARRQLGLFHDPTKFHVRVRNVILRGDWPEKLPKNLFELRPATEKVPEVLLSPANSR